MQLTKPAAASQLAPIKSAALATGKELVSSSQTTTSQGNGCKLVSSASLLEIER